MRMRTPLAALGLALAFFLVVISIGGLFVWQGYRDTLNRGEQRAAAAVLSGIKVKNDGFDVMLHPARIVPHTLTSRHTPVVLSIILLCGFLIYGYRSTQGSALGKLRKP